MLLRFLLTAALFAFVPAQAQSPHLPFTDTGTVTKVRDGDTLELASKAHGSIVVRLEGIDAPERTQAYSQRAKQVLYELTKDTVVKVRCSKGDRYGREVCLVTAGVNDVGLELIRKGLAWHFVKYEKEQPESERVAYAVAEHEAKAARAGLWGFEEPMAPWVCRDNLQQRLRCK